MSAGDTLDSEDAAQLRSLLAQRETSLNRQLGITMFCAGLAYGLCLLCSLTGVFLTGKALGVLGFLPGMIFLLVGSLVSYLVGRTGKTPPWLKHYLLLSLLAAVLDVSLIQLVWGVPCLVGFVATVYAYHNLRITCFYNTVILIGVFVAAAFNALWGMPNPDMLPYPEAISGIPDGYVTLWAMSHPDEWSRFDYFTRILRFHTLPLIFLLGIVAGCGYAMSRRTWQRFAANLAQTRRIREIETCLLLMAGGLQSNELLKAVLGEQGTDIRANPPLSDEFVASIPAAEIPRLMKAFRARCDADPAFAALAARDPESALKRL